MKVSIGEKKYNLTLISAIYWLYILFFLIQNLTSVSTNFCIGIMMILGMVAFVYVIFDSKEYFIKKSIFLAIMFLCLAIISNVYTRNENIIQLLSFLSYVGIALVIVKYPISEALMQKTYIITVVWYVIRYILGYANRGVFVKSGTVSTDIVLLIFYCIIVILKNKNRKYVNIWLSLIGIFPVLMSQKRMGIIVWSMLILINIFWDQKNNKLKFMKAIPYLLLCVMIAFVIVPTFFDDYMKAVVDRFMYDGLSLKGFAYSRSGMWENYILGLKYDNNLLWGVPYTFHVFFDIYSGNMHNSFLNCHAIFGLCGLIVLLCIMIMVTKKYMKNKQWYILAIFAILVLRGMSDQVFAKAFGDIVFIAFLIYPYSETQIKRSDEN